MWRWTRRSGERHQALRRIRSNGPLRRTLMAFALFRVAELSVWVALTAYAFQVGGIRESATLLVAQLVPAAVFAVAVGGLVHRLGPVRVLRAGYAVQTCGLVIAASVLAGGGPRLAAYAGAVLAATAVSATRPSQSVLLPSVVDGPVQLTAANVVVGTIDGAAALVGPATAAVLMSVIGAWSVLAVMAGATLTAAGLVWRMHQRPTSESDDSSIGAGLRAVAGTPGPRVVVCGLGVHSILYGAVDVLAVVVAVDQLQRPEAFGGWVTAAFGAGMLVAGLASFAVLGRRRLAPGIIAAALGVGASLALVSVVDRRAAAVLILIGSCGLSASLYELTSRMLLQRISGLDVLGHVFSLVEAVQMAMLAVGSASVPFVVHALGTRWAAAGIGGLMVLTVAILGPALVRVDRQAHVPLTEMAALRATPLLAPLPAPTLETLAREARREEVAAGTVVVRRGEPGSDYYAVVSGRLHVVTDDRTVQRLARGDGFGEIALLHGTTRTATVHAVEPSIVLAVGRDAFLTAVAGHAATLERALAIADGWSA